MRRACKVIDFSGDVGLVIRGNNMEEVFENAAKGLYKLISPSDFAPKTSIKITLTSIDKESLLVNWLNELIFLFDAKGFIGCKAVFEKLNDNELVASIWGDYFDKDKHKSGILIKAATYHNLVFKKEQQGLLAQIIFDI
jgi:SHS2 domain-containing protein